jgi:hypothetical protein
MTKLAMIRTASVIYSNLVALSYRLPYGSLIIFATSEIIAKYVSVDLL